MSVAEWNQIKDLLHRAITLPREKRGEFVARECGADETLRGQLESLLAVDEELQSDFLRTGLPMEYLNVDSWTGFSLMSAGDVFAERFILIRELGTGGMGQVWLAEQTVPIRRPVAIKLIRTGVFDNASLGRFHYECQSLALMDHPAIAKVYEVGSTPLGQPFMVMEFIAGVPITEYCDHHGLSVRGRLAIFIEACAGVQHAHQKAIIHRDLKPANILVTEIDGRPTPRIIDFGLAKSETSSSAGGEPLTRVGLFLGTPGYMSPEQLQHRDVDTRTDVYSLGVMLYVLLCGHSPVPTADRHELSLEEWLRRLRDSEPKRPSTRVRDNDHSTAARAAARGTTPKRLGDEIRGDLDWITLKAMERDRERRYESAAALSQDLHRYLRHEPVLARPESTPYRVMRFARRHAVAASVIAFVVILALAASASGILAIRKAQEAALESSRAVGAQVTLLVDAAIQHLRTHDVSGAQNIILEALNNPMFSRFSRNSAISAFQDVRAADRQLMVLSGHGDKVNAALFSPDGRHIVTASGDRTVRVWDASIGRQELVLRGHDDGVLSVAYSRDGSRIVSTSGDGTARLWDAATGGLLAVFTGHRAGVWHGAFSADGSRIITSAEDGTIRIWDVTTRTPLRTIVATDGIAYDASFSPGGDRILGAYSDGIVRIWDARSGRPLVEWQAHAEYIYTARWSPDGQYIVTASTDKSARVWNSHTGAPVHVLFGHESFVRSAEFSSDGQKIITSSTDNTARLWDARTGHPLDVLSGHSAFVYSAAFSNDNSRIVTASADRTARVWNVQPPAPLADATLPGFLYFASFSPDGAKIVTASDDGSARIVDAHNLREIVRLQGPKQVLLSAMFSPDSGKVVTAAIDRHAYIWNAHTGGLLTVLTGHISNVYFAAFSPDSSRVVTASRDKTVRIWDAQSGALQSTLTGHHSIVHSAEFSPDGRRLLTACEDGSARIWDVATGKQIIAMEGHTGILFHAAFSSDGTRVVTASGDHTARVWDARTGQLLTVLAGHGQFIMRAGFSHDGRHVVTASDDGTVRIWDTTSGMQLGLLPIREAHMSSAEYSPDDKSIVTTNFAHSLALWDARVDADLGAQIAWYSAAQIDPLTEAHRDRLGLTQDPSVRRTSANATACDRFAGAPFDPNGKAYGPPIASIDVDLATRACEVEIEEPSHPPRIDFQMGRALLAKGDLVGARRHLEKALDLGYIPAAVDLSGVLGSPSDGSADLDRAKALLQSAWRAGVPIAAFRLGNLLNDSSGDNRGLTTAAPKSAAWQWYMKGAQIGEPYALARYGEEEERLAGTSSNLTEQQRHWFQAFKWYAAAAERGRILGWPDDVWVFWRHRRASLARVLASGGMMQALGETYATISKTAGDPAALWVEVAVAR